MTCYVWAPDNSQQQRKRRKNNRMDARTLTRNLFNGHDSFFLQRPVGTLEQLAPFLHRFVLRLEKHDAPDGRR
jgi:hypothetical protein